MRYYKIQANVEAWKTAQDTKPLKEHLGFAWEDYQHAVIDEFLCIVAGCVLGTYVCCWMFKKRSTWLKVNVMAILRTNMNWFYCTETINLFAHAFRCYVTSQ